MKNRLFVVLILTAMSAGCFSYYPDYHDYYSEVKDDCLYLTSPKDQATTRTAGRKKPYPTLLTSECKKSLEDIVVFDSSWDGAPSYMKDKVLEALHVMISYPLAPSPDFTLLGVAPNIIPANIFCIFSGEFCMDEMQESDWYRMNEYAFNFFMHQVDEIKFGGEDGSALASYNTDMNLTINTPFAGGVWDAYFGNPFLRAGTLLHEAFHGDFNQHIPGGSNDDYDFTGAHTMNMVYAEFIIQGSVCRMLQDGGSMLIDKYYMVELVRRTLMKLSQKIRDLPEAFDEIERYIEVPYLANDTWILKQMCNWSAKGVPFK